MATHHRCNVEGCKTPDMEPDKGFNVTLSFYVRDRSDQDADGETRELHACSQNHLADLLGELGASVAEKFTEKGKTLRKGRRLPKPKTEATK